MKVSEMFSKRAKERAAGLAFFVVSRLVLAALNKLLFRIATASLGLGMSGKNQPDERLLRRHLRCAFPPSPLVIDVGGNCGQYRSMVRKEIPQAQIISFEPHPTALAELLRIPGIRAINMAVGDRPDRLKLFDYGSAPGSEHASVVPGRIEKIHHRTVSTIVVECTTLDLFLKKCREAHVDLLKIDVEGCVLAVWKGAKRAIANTLIGVVQFEF
jgi:FkbM family methyltransferase